MVAATTTIIGLVETAPSARRRRDHRRQHGPGQQRADREPAARGGGGQHERPVATASAAGRRSGRRWRARRRWRRCVRGPGRRAGAWRRAGGPPASAGPLSGLADSRADGGNGRQLGRLGVPVALLGVVVLGGVALGAWRTAERGEAQRAFRRLPLRLTVVSHSPVQFRRDAVPRTPLRRHIAAFPHRGTGSQRGKLVISLPRDRGAHACFPRAPARAVLARQAMGQNKDWPTVSAPTSSR